MIVKPRLHVWLAASIITDTPSIMWPGMVCGCGRGDGDVNAVSGQHHYLQLCSAPAQCHSCRRRPAHRDTWRRGVALDTGHTGHRVSSSTVNIHNNTHHWYHKHSIQHDTWYIGILIVVNASYPNRFEVTILCKHIFDRFLRKTPGLHSLHSTESTSTPR